MSENTSESDREEESSNRTPWDTPRRDFLKATGAGASALTLGTTATMTSVADSHVTVTVDLADDDIDSGDTTEATVSISGIPNGLSGVLGDAMVSDSSVAEISGASFPDGWGLTQDPDISADGSSVNLVTADISGNYSAGDTNIELFTLELTGQSAGQVTIELEDLVEDEDGNFYDFDLESPTLTVDGGTGDGEEGDNGDDNEDDNDDDNGTGDGDVTVTIDLSNDDIDVGDSTEATVTVSEIPNGLSGVLGDAMVTDSSVAEITGASFPDGWGLTQDPEISADGSSVNLVTADIDGNFSAGDTNVELFTLELEGVGEGQTSIDLEDLVEDADGNFYDFDLESPALSVGGGPVSPPEDVTVTIDLSNDDIDAGDTTEATATISEIPNGLSGLLGDAMVSDSSVAEITGASFPSGWGLTQDPEISADGSSVNLVTADIDGNFSAGDTNVELFTLELEGVGEGETSVELEDLVEDANGDFYDFDLESPTLSVEGDSNGDPEPSPDALVVDDFESTGQWNDLGRWRGGGSFQNGGGDISGGELVLEYDNAGWYATQVDEDISEYDELVLAVRGDSGGEESDFTVSLGGGNSLASSVADGSISTGTSDLRIDLDAMGANKSSPGQLNLNFWQGGNSTIYIDQIRFE